MGFKALSTTRSGAASIVSKQSVIVNTVDGFAVSGATISGNTSINIEVTTPGQGTTVTPVSGGGLTLTSINYLNANGTISTANAVSTLGGNIKINGTGFSDPMTVLIGSTQLSNSNVTVANSTAIIASLGSASPGNVSAYAFNSSGSGAQLANAVFYSGAPAWTTSSVNFQNNTAANVQLVASSDSTLTYTLQAGSSLPTGISLISTGYLSGTATGYSTNTSSSAVIVATDLEGQATQQTITWTVSVADPQFPYVTLLLNGDTGNNISNGATNNTFVDSSTNNFSITRTGTTTQGTFAPFSQTGWSLNFNRSRVDSTLTGKTPGTGSFTYELFFNVTVKDAAIANVAALFSTRGSGSGSNGFDVQITTAGAVQIGTSGATLFTSSNSLVTNGSWYHLAIVRNGTTNWTVYLNGSSIGTISNSTNFTSADLYLGVFGGNTQDWFKGYISNFRYTRDAVYTTNFTPPTAPLTAIANTEFLSCQSNRYKDNSVNNFTVTPVALNGSSSVQAVSPFSPSASYATSVNGGSAYLDGSGNYLSLATNAAFNITSGSTDSFICEFWVNWVTVAANMSIIDNGGLNGVSFANWSVTLNASSQITLNWANSAAPGSTIGTLPTSIVPVTGQWYHIAFVKTNADWALFVNGTRATNFNGLNTAAKTSATALYIGYGIATSAAGNAFKGYISNVRIYKGATAGAPYAATSLTITVPTEPVTAITNTSLLTNFTNAGIADAHSTTILQTVGSTQLSTVVKKFSSASMYFDGNGDWLQVPSPSQTIAFATGDFTVECWVNFAANNGTYNPFVRYDGAGTFDLGYDFSAGQLKYSGSTALISAAWSPTLGTWYHIALSRASGSSRMFVNGTQVGTTVTGDANNYASGAFKVGGSSFSSGHVMNGYMDDLRITRGFARYTANFTPPAAAFQGQ